MLSQRGYASHAQSTSAVVTARGALARDAIIALIAFLTVVDLFATQALLPSLAKHYGVSAAAMGTAVNASTLGMAMAGLGVAYFGRRIDRRRGVVGSLALVSIPTALLALAPDLATFTALRIVQGVLMATAFTLTLAYFAETTSGRETAAAYAAYIAGNVASNLLGRLLAALLADTAGLAASFLVFATLNLAGAVLVTFALTRMAHMAVPVSASTTPFGIWRAHLSSPSLRAAFAIGFCILFAFIGTFTYVNFVLVRAPFSLGMMSLGLVYFVFLPSIVTTLSAGSLARRLGARRALQLSLGIAGVGLPLLLLPSLVPVLVGLSLVGIGTFLAQATATAFVGRTASTDLGAASGIYLACYFIGGMTGSAVLGVLFTSGGWAATVMGIGIALSAAAFIAGYLRDGGSDQT